MARLFALLCTLICISCGFQTATSLLKKNHRGALVVPIYCLQEGPNQIKFIDKKPLIAEASCKNDIIELFYFVSPDELARFQNQVAQNPKLLFYLSYQGTYKNHHLFSFDEQKEMMSDEHIFHFALPAKDCLVEQAKSVYDELKSRGGHDPREAEFRGGRCFVKMKFP